MLNNVPAAVNRMARNVVINHPNTFNCQVFRKTVTRAAPTTIGGLPTLGGLGVLDTTDEDEFTYTWIGNGFALPLDQFDPSSMSSHRDAQISTSANEFRFAIEAEEQAGSPGAFTPKKADVFYLLLGSGPGAAKLAFEIVDVETTVNIPPYTSRYVACRRDELHVAAG